MHRPALRTDIALALLVLLVTVPVVQIVRAQQQSRVALTAAVWDDATVRIDPYPISVDRAERDGHIYSDKAPGQPLLAVPAYALYRAVGGEPATVLRVESNLGLWWLSVWSAAIPAALLAVLLRRAAARVAPEAALPVALALTFGTQVLPFATLLFGHVLSALLLVAGWLLATESDRPRPAPLAAAGALLGLAVLTEYTMAFAALVIAVSVLVAHRSRVLWLVVGAVPMGAVLLAYQWAAFGDPLSFSYSNRTFQDEVGDRAIRVPVIENIVRVLIGERGMLLVSPIVLLAVAGMVQLLRSDAAARAVRTGYVAALAGAVSLIGVQLLWPNPTGGDSPGPRYATAAVALLAPGLAFAWQRWRTMCVVAAGYGTAVMLLATWTDPLEPQGSSAAIASWLRKAVRGDFADTVYEMAFGSFGFVLLPLGAALGALVLQRAVRAEAPASTT